jgi:peptidoglycan/xylan/chitin deacetylase (PgdA/CDA1 family)
VTILRYGPAVSDDRATFDAQLQFLVKCGFRSVRLGDLRSAAERRHPIGGRTVLLTFDDGGAGFARDRWPLLERYGFAGLCFVSPTDVGDPAILAELVGRGAELGVRPAADVPATTLEPGHLLADAMATRASLEAVIGHPLSAWAYPKGDEDEIARRLIAAAGFEFGFTLSAKRARWHRPLLALPRIAVTSALDLNAFVTRLAPDGGV